MGRSLRTYSLIKGLPVFEIKSGSKLGEVSDINISNDGKVKGLIVKNGVFFSKAKMISMQNVSSFGNDGVMIETRELLESIQDKVINTFENQDRLSGKVIMTKEGEHLGILEDVYFQEELGTIVGYELSDGFFSDIIDGKRVVKTDEPPAIGKDAIIVNVK